jgi:hypothetical protein
VMRHRQLEIGLALMLAFILAACGAHARQTTIRITYESTNIADDQLMAFTKIRSKAIVDDAKAAGKTKEAAGAELDAFLAKAQHAQLTVNAVYRMVGAAAALNDDRSLSTLLAVFSMLTAELKELGVKLP